MLSAYEMVDGGESMIYHLLFYMIGNFCTVPNCYDFIYYYPKSKHPFVEDMLNTLPHNWIRHYTKDPEINYTKSHIRVPSFMDWEMPEKYQYLQMIFTWHTSKARIPGNNIYISREKVNRRHILNEDTLMKTIEPLGFRKIHMEDLKVADQIRLFSEADIILAPHGSALSYITFCNPGTTLIEILDLPPTKLRHYSHICWALGLEYHRFQNVQRDGENFIVNTEKIEELLGIIMRRGNNDNTRE